MITWSKGIFQGLGERWSQGQEVLQKFAISPDKSRLALGSIIWLVSCHYAENGLRNMKVVLTVDCPIVITSIGDTLFPDQKRPGMRNDWSLVKPVFCIVHTGSCSIVDLKMVKRRRGFLPFIYQSSTHLGSHVDQGGEGEGPCGREEEGGVLG